MGEQRAYGHGSYADKKMRFTTIEQKWSHFKKWYDNALKNTQIANPALSRRALMRAGSSRCVPWCVQLLAARSAHPSAGQKWRRRRRSSGSPAADKAPSRTESDFRAQDFFCELWKARLRARACSSSARLTPTLRPHFDA